MASSAASVEQVVARIRPGRAIEGLSAVLMPFSPGGRPDLDMFGRLLERTVKADLVPAVNMDTGYVHMLSAAARIETLEATRRVLGSRRFVAGAFVEDATGPLGERYARACHEIFERGGTPILFPCSELKALPGAAVVRLFRELAAGGPGLLAFELGEAFAAFGRIFDADTVKGLVESDGILGLKHSSLDRGLEWERLELRDRLRPGFKVYTGNDLAIDMVMFGSDYLLGLSAFAPEAFALRDRYWRTGDARFFTLNDRLQYLGSFAFRPPTPAYRHSAAQFLKLTGALQHDAPPSGAPARPASDIAVLAEIASSLRPFLDADD
jgi:dihydrodipicolinate synthase/N-acetylneuraminate lyase